MCVMDFLVLRNTTRCTADKTGRIELYSKNLDINRMTLLRQAHGDRNLARKLTPKEKKEKKHKKLVGEAREGDAPVVSVYVISKLTNPSHHFKVRVNAEVRENVINLAASITCCRSLANEEMCWFLGDPGVVCTTTMDQLGHGKGIHGVLWLVIPPATSM